MNVYQAAQARLQQCLDGFERVVVYFSGGKDSTVLLHLLLDLYPQERAEIVVVFIDWEVQFTHTISFAESMRELCLSKGIKFMWYCLPLVTVNATSMFEPEWTGWDPVKKDRWVRSIPEYAITSLDGFQFPMTFEEFVPRLNANLSQGQKTICLSGIRGTESLFRYRTMTSDVKHRYQDLAWTTLNPDATIHGYPIIDWSVSDIWIYLTTLGKPYNKLYDLMFMAGVPPSHMRVCEPFGNEQKQGLWLYHVLDSNMWSRMLDRVSGANFGSLYAKGRSTIQGKKLPELPNAGTSWKVFVEGLLDSLPPETSRHYRAKIFVYVNWCLKHGYVGDIPDLVDGDMGSKDVPSWRRVARAILRNDYWCLSLSFSPTKKSNYERYLARIEHRKLKEDGDGHN